MSATTIAESSSSQIRYGTGILLVLLAGTVWSTIGIGIRNIEVANVWQILFYRSIALSTFLFVLILFRSGYKPFASIINTGWAGVIGGIGLVIAFAGGIYSIQITTVANAMFLFASAPFMAAVLGWWLLKEKVHNTTWIAMYVAIIGILIMVLNGLSAGRLVGNLAAVLSAGGFAVFTIALRWRKLEDMMPAVFLGGLFAALVSAFICITASYGFEVPTIDISIALALGVFQVGVGLTIYTIGSKVVPAAELALLSLTEVLLGPLWVWFFMGETASVYTLLGGGILLAAIAGNAISGLRRKPVPII